MLSNEPGGVHERLSDLLDVLPMPDARMPGYLSFLYELHRALRHCGSSPGRVVEPAVARWQSRGLAEESSRRLAAELCRPEWRCQHAFES